MKLEVAQGDGASLRTHLQRLYRNTRRLDPQLKAASEPLPGQAALLWSVYAELGSPVTHAELDAWQRVHRVRLSSWEVETLLALDARSNRPH